MQNSVDILPYLERLEILKAHCLFPPIYMPDVVLPLVQTLRVLHLKSASVRWMAGQIFPALKECSIIFPHHTDAIQSVRMSSCSVLKYDSNNLGTLEHFHLPSVARLEVACGQWRTWRGNLHLAPLYRIFAVQSLTCLHLDIKCNERLFAHMLALSPALEELWMGLSSPHALSRGFFLAFAAGGPNASAVTGPSSQTIVPLCQELKKLHLHYKRWLRGPERKALIPTFGNIVASHQPSREPSFSLSLSFGEAPKELVWKVHRPVEGFGFEGEMYQTCIGFPSPHGIVRLSTVPPGDGAYFRHFKDLEYITIMGSKYPEPFCLPIGFFFPFHSLREVRMHDLVLEISPTTQFPSNLPLFHTLKVLHVSHMSFLFWAGQTFHKLERFKEETSVIMHNPRQGTLTEMPVCTRLVVELPRLATLNLPQIRELGVCMNCEEANCIWETRVAVNTNLSGLKLLHLWDHYRLPERPIIDIIRIVRSLPALETLVIDSKYLVVPYDDFFEAFVPTDVQETSGLNQSSGNSHILGVLCPRLENLQIEGIGPIKEPELLPILEDVVTLRAFIGSPLHSFTFYDTATEKKWELIGRDRNFNMEEVVPTQRFRIDI
jgi:hypothetical protein